MNAAVQSSCSLSRRLCAEALGVFFIFAVATAAVAADGPMGVERVARLTPLGYQSQPADRAGEIRWVQVDLGKSQKIETVKLFPLLDFSPTAQNFPVRFRLESSDDPEFKTAATVSDCTGADYADPGDVVGLFRSAGVNGRYVRLTVTQSRERDKRFYFSLSKMDVDLSCKTPS